MFFTGGQDWGFPPLHPGQMRERGFEYMKLAVQNHMRYSGALRIDHVMGLYRLFWIPRGVSAQDGVYVTYPANELQAVLSIESHRAHCSIIGEDLGTVPDSVRESMGERNLLRMYVAQFEMKANPDAGLNTPPAAAMASLNTHDTVLFGGYYQGRDIDISHKLGFVDDDEVASRHHDRDELMASLAAFLQKVTASQGEGTARMVLEGTLKHLAASDAEILMVSLEDLWLEPEPQNVPGTGDDWGNWSRKAQFTFEEFSNMPEVTDLLRAINDLRGGKIEPD
jgi:4-alpha-glucanotransferase